MAWAEATVVDLFADAVRARPDGEAVVGGEQRLTYADLAVEVDSLAEGMRELGVEKGDRVAVWMVNRAEWLVTYFAAARIGAVLVTLNPRYTAQECEHILRTAGVAVLIMQSRHQRHDYVELLRSLCPEIDSGSPGSWSSRALPALREVVVLGDGRPGGAHAFEDVQGLGARRLEGGAEPAAAEVKPDDLFLLLFTSGTTSKSRGVMLTHRNIVANNFASGERQRLTAEDRMLFVLPLPSAFSCAHGLVAILSHHGTFVLLDRFTPTGCLQIIERERCTSLYGVGSMFSDLIAAPERHDYDLSSLRTGVGILTPDVAEAVRTELGIAEYHNGWGMTETGGVSTMTSPGDPVETRTGTIGTPLPGVELKIADPVTGAILEHGMVGEIMVRGSSVTPGYYADPGATATLIDDQGWVHTADLGRILPGGYVSYLGRTKDVIKTDGNSVSPTEVEAVLIDIPGVREAAVIGVPDPRSMEAVYAFVVFDADADPLDADQIRRLCRERLAGFKVPRHVEVRADRLPRNDLGKVLRKDLRSAAAERAHGASAGISAGGDDGPSR